MTSYKTSYCRDVLPFKLVAGLFLLLAGNFNTQTSLGQDLAAFTNDLKALKLTASILDTNLVTVGQNLLVGKGLASNPVGRDLLGMGVLFTLLGQSTNLEQDMHTFVSTNQAFGQTLAAFTNDVNQLVKIEPASALPTNLSSISQELTTLKHDLDGVQTNVENRINPSIKTSAINATNLILSKSLGALGGDLHGLGVQVSAGSNFLGTSPVLSGLGNLAAIPTNQSAFGGFSKTVSLQTGVILFSPFTLSKVQSNPQQYKFTSGNAQTAEFLEAFLPYRFAWRHDIPHTDGVEHYEGKFVIQGDDYSGEHVPLDLELRSGYAFGSGQSSPTIGSGQGYGELSTGVAIVRWITAATTDSRMSIYTVGVEGFGSLVSDPQFSVLHESYGAGVTIVGGIPISTNGQAQILARIGYAQTDVPVLNGTGPEVSGGTTNTVTLVRVGGNGVPEFQTRGAIQVAFEARISLNQNAYIGFGGTYDKMLNGGPDPWQMQLSLTLTAESVMNAFGSFLGAFK